MSGHKLPFPAWLKKTQAGENIIISTRIRLARNVSGLRFPSLADKTEQEKLLRGFRDFLSKSALPSTWQFLSLREFDNIFRGVLAERGLISMESARDPGFSGLAYGPGQSQSVLLNEEDHVRLQVIREGLNLERGLKLARELDENLGRFFAYALHPSFGFLTACPTNVGTGLRASVMLHLPALTLTRGIIQVLQAVLHMGLAVRGFYGEGSELKTVFFQVSNQVTLGRTEDEIIQHLAGVTHQIVEREEEARQKLLKDNAALLEDKVGRALGMLERCRLLGFEEALDLMSALRLGVETRIIKPIPKSVLNEMLLMVQPAHLQMAAKKPLAGEQQNAFRATLVKKRLKLKEIYRGA